ncbi:phosphoribosylformylglycinamidine synthase [Methanosarcinales archaeon ex4484_138]|nr:MAG: phosphoribosylformylglycinamidine synthase [Methanosarcinales archaeon ex4484_138]RLG26442.1 MAG: phosphoribosylformylglycinamidine synthase [Methanosarcinales archaeon]RLG26582.1 MAG: phosphoribosylformylglycinamidine synthase [Methanosarcinales archaeon]
MKYIVDITVQLKDGMRDPEASTLQRSLEQIGFKTHKLTLAKKFHVTIDAESEDAAEEQGRAMCERLLANPVIHNYTITVVRK